MKPPTDSARPQTGGKESWYIAGTVAALVAMVLFLFDPSRYSFYPTCAFHKATGLLCPGCGSLRAAHHLLHGELVTAFRFNPLLMTLLPFVTGFAAVYCIRKMQGKTAGFGVTSKWLWAVLGIAVVFTVWRNIPGGGLATLPQ